MDSKQKDSWSSHNPKGSTMSVDDANQDGNHVELDGFRFAMIPEDLIYSEASGTSIKVFGALLRHGSDPADCYPSYKRLANLCHVSVPTVRRAVAELVDAGWVTVVRRRADAGGQTSNGYRVHDRVGGKESCTPLITGDLPPLITGDHPPCSPVINEREPSNESHLNDIPPTSHFSQNRETRNDEERNDGGRVASQSVADHPKPALQSVESEVRGKGNEADALAEALPDASESELRSISSLIRSEGKIRNLKGFARSESGKEDLRGRLERCRNERGVSAEAGMSPPAETWVPASSAPLEGPRASGFASARAALESSANLGLIRCTGKRKGIAGRNQRTYIPSNGAAKPALPSGAHSRPLPLF